MITVAVLRPGAEGSNTIVKVVEPAGATVDDGCTVTVKPAALAPVDSTRGVPVKVSVPAPVLVMVKGRLTVPLAASTPPKSVPLAAAVTVEPSAAGVAPNFTCITGERPVPWRLKS